MTTKLNDALTTTCVGVLEDLCFVCPDPTEDGRPSPRDALSVEVAFRGPVGGKVALRFLDVPREEIASAMLGESDGVISEADLRDAMGEVANVICGQLLPRIGGAAAVFDLDAPKFIEKTPGAASDAFVALSALGGRVEVSLFVSAGSFAGQAP